MKRSLLNCIAATVWMLAIAPSSAEAFCGFFVGNTDELYNDATQVVLMRSGQHTVTSMRPTYSGPVEDFAMVIPVAQVLQKEDVRTMSPRPFDAVQKLSAPRLVEYHEQDPCAHHRRRKSRRRVDRLSATMGSAAKTDDLEKPAVRVKAKFNKGEYKIVILDADESSALETWLNENGYKQPPGASKYLAPYVQSGTYFFAAKVDAEKAKFGKDGEAVLSPLQFRYQSNDFKLPIRLGLINARGPQDLLIFILGESRYEVANRRNLFIPTNINVSHKRKKDFADWYDGLFERTTENRETSVVTEYVWPTTVKCDPCPPGTSMLGRQNLSELGGKLLQGKANPRNMILTRLHTRYEKGSGTSDLVFQKAGPVAGGREIYKNGKLEKGASEAGRNAFQGRYSIRYRWRGELTCDDPRYGNWSHSVRRTVSWGR